jgi:hypothetical protein
VAGLGVALRQAGAVKFALSARKGGCGVAFGALSRTAWSRPASIPTPHRRPRAPSPLYTAGATTARAAATCPAATASAAAWTPPPSGPARSARAHPRLCAPAASARARPWPRSTTRASTPSTDAPRLTRARRRDASRVGSFGACSSAAFVQPAMGPQPLTRTRRKPWAGRLCTSGAVVNACLGCLA